MSRLTNWFQQLSTAGKLLLLLTAAILPLGLVLVAAATNGIGEANRATAARATDQGRLALKSVDGLIGRRILALRVAASENVVAGDGDSCRRVARALSVAPNVPDSFLVSDSVGTRLCSWRDPDDGERPTLLVAPGQVRVWLSVPRGRLYYRVGVYGGSATGVITREELREAALAARADDGSLTVSDGQGELSVSLGDDARPGIGFERSVYAVEQQVAAGQLRARAEVAVAKIAEIDRLVILLPVLMWILAALLSWLAIRAFLLVPLRRVQQAVASHDPASGPLVLPDRLGSAIEIRQLGEAFVRAVERIEASEKSMAEALDGQRKLVREVHHRVKNNLQVVASLLNIHRRSARSEDAKDAYTSIGRRVDALAVVHRNHYAELEENRGIALRPLLSELAANLRASAPDDARMLDIGLDLESLNTTQDVAVATAFLVTEIVEHAMLTEPTAPVTLTLRRKGPLSARFTIATDALKGEAQTSPEYQQFERIITGLARQLRSVLDREPGLTSVDLPVFPDH